MRLNRFPIVVVRILLTSKGVSLQNRQLNSSGCVVSKTKRYWEFQEANLPVSPLLAHRSANTLRISSTSLWLADKTLVRQSGSSL